MTERRITVDHEAESDRRLLYVLEELGRMQTAHEERIKTLIDGLREYVGFAVESALARHMAALAHPEDKQLRPVAIRASEHVGDHWWQIGSSRFTRLAFKFLLTVVFALAAFVAFKLGVIP